MSQTAIAFMAGVWVGVPAGIFVAGLCAAARLAGEDAALTKARRAAYGRGVIPHSQHEVIDHGADAPAIVTDPDVVELAAWAERNHRVGA